GRLVGLAVRGQVAGEQDQVDAGDPRKGFFDALATLGAAVDVARRGDADRPRHRPNSSGAIESSAAGYPVGVPEHETPFDELLETLKNVAGLLRESEVPFLLGDAERAREVLAKAGLRTEEPPEGWLYKAYDGEVMIDLIFGPSGQPIEDAVFGRAEELNVNAVPMRVMALEDVFVTKLTAMR